PGRGATCLFNPNPGHRSLRCRHIGGAHYAIDYGSTDGEQSTKDCDGGGGRLCVAGWRGDGDGAVVRCDAAGWRNGRNSAGEGLPDRQWRDTARVDSYSGCRISEKCWKGDTQGRMAWHLCDQPDRKQQGN